MHYARMFTESPNKQYVEGKTCFVDMIYIGDFNIELVNTVLNCIGYEDDDDLHKMMYVYVEKVEKTESSSDEEGEGDSESEDGNDFVDEEHLVDEVEVNMKDDTEFIDPIQPNENVTEDDLEVLDFDSLESDQDDENARSMGLRMLRKNHKSSGISNNFYVGKKFPDKDLAKERIKAYAVETRRNLDFKRNDKRRIRVICNGVVSTFNSMNEYVDQVQGSKQDTSEKGKAVMENLQEDKMTCP
ncbi:hypothetical protein Tco_0273352 [Tanacetum coccineum]